MKRKGTINMTEKPKYLSAQPLLIYVLENVVKRACGCTLLRQNLIANQVKYPFATFNWIVLEQRITSDWLDESTPFYSTVQIDFHSDDYIKAMNLATKFFNDLHKTSLQLCFSQANIVVSDMEKVEDRTALAEANYDYTVGFDCTFLVNNKNECDLAKLRFDYEDTEIETVSYKKTEEK